MICCRVLSAPTRAAWSGSRNCNPRDTCTCGPERPLLTAQNRADIAAKQPPHQDRNRPLGIDMSRIALCYRDTQVPHISTSKGLVDNLAFRQSKVPEARREQKQAS